MNANLLGGGAVSESRFLIRSLWAILGLLAAMLVAEILLSPHLPVYDEGYYFQTTGLLQHFGLSRAFLLHLPGPAGPTFTLVYGAVEKSFGITFPFVRFTSFILFAAGLICLAGALRRYGDCLTTALSIPSGLAAAAIIGLPTAAVSAGMALTETPSFFPACLSLWLLFIAANRRHRIYVVLACFFMAGMALGLAIIGRQNYLVALACIPLMARRKTLVEDGLGLGLFFGGALSVMAPVFLVWKGIVPPLSPVAPSGFVPQYALLSGAYAGFLCLLLAPGFFRSLFSRKAVATILVLSLGVNFLFPGGWMPMMTLPLWTASPFLAVATGRVFAILVAGMAISFYGIMAIQWWRERNHPAQRFVLAAAGLGILSNGGITHQFSSRYVFVFLPFLIPALVPAMRLDRYVPWRLALGGILGLTSLAAYFALF